MNAGNIKRNSAILVLSIFVVFSLSDIGFCLKGGIFCVESPGLSEGCHPADEAGHSCHPIETDGIHHSQHTDHSQSCEQAIPGRHEHQKRDYSLPDGGWPGYFSLDSVPVESYPQDTISSADCFIGKSIESTRSILISLRTVIMLT
ncbi:MAG: hypothetical protein KAV42_01320 [Candidatus Krumholzibacteria bacterium]|nr:hypothetical protein [Candidatus Krumholzibacteria bacterium]